MALIGLVIFYVGIILPICLILISIWIKTKKAIFGKVIAAVFFAPILLLILVLTYESVFQPYIFNKKDYYGSYVINTNFCPGKQANWQYNTYRFEIKKNDSIYFYVTDKEKIVQTYVGSISVTNKDQYSSARLKIHMPQPTIHILETNPTIYRSRFSFKLIFYSKKFKNMCFKKGEWRAL